MANRRTEGAIPPNGGTMAEEIGTSSACLDNTTTTSVEEQEFFRVASLIPRGIQIFILESSRLEGASMSIFILVI